MNSPAFLHPVMQEALALLKKVAPRGTLTSTFRSVGEQAKLRRAYEQKRSKFPAERPGHSTHHTGLAFDFVVREGARSPQQYELGRWWESIGGIWAGERDPVHFQHPAARDALAAGLVKARWWA